jgi:hypothetical protein
VALVVLISIPFLLQSSGGESLASVLGAISVVLVAAFAVQLRHYRDRPPPEFWETHWYEWKRPLLVGVPGVAGVLTWIISGGQVEATIWFTAVPAAFAVLNAAASRFGAFTARNRLDVRSSLHLD